MHACVALPELGTDQTNQRVGRAPGGGPRPGGGGAGPGGGGGGGGARGALWVGLERYPDEYVWGEFEGGKDSLR